MFRFVLYNFLCWSILFSHSAWAQALATEQQFTRLVQQSMDRSTKAINDTIISQKETLAQLEALQPSQAELQRVQWLEQKDYLRYPEPVYQPLFKLSATDLPAVLEFHGWLQADQDIFFNTAGIGINSGFKHTSYASDTVDRLWIRRLRPSLEGTFANYFNFLINPDFGLSQVRLFDGFLDINYLRAIGLQSGLQMSLVSGVENFFDNFSYLSRAYTMEMSNSAMMAPDREFGFVLHGSFGPSGHEPYYRGLSYLGFDDMFSYQLGVFNGTPDNASIGLNFISNNKDQLQSAVTNKAFEARIFINPFIDYANSTLQHLGVGMAGSRDNAHNQGNLPDLVSIGQNAVFKYTGYSALANGLRYRLHPQAVWYLGPMGVLADWAQTTQTLCDASGNFGAFCPVNATSITQKNNAGQIQLIYNVTQEDFNLFHLIPNNNFNLSEAGTYGAWQAVFRFTKLAIDKKSFQQALLYGIDLYPYASPINSIQRSNSWSLGLNWFWNDNFRITTEYDHTQFIGGGCSGGSDTYGACPSGLVANRPAEQIFMQRLQLTF